MIQSLRIQNFAIIDKIEVNLTSGLNIVTGETGAGKSILLGATGLILGQRANSKSLFNPNKKCVIEGIFSISEYNLQPFFTENDLDFDNETIVRREISAAGKSRAFINDTPVSLSVLIEFASQLVDLHQQFDTLQLQQESFQINALDALADHKPLLLNYKKAFDIYKKVTRELKILQQKAHEDKKEEDFLQFQMNELEEASVVENEEKTLESEQSLLDNTENIQLALGKAIDMLEESDQAMLPILEEINHQILQAGNEVEPIRALQEKLDSIIIELTDWLRDADKIKNQVEADPKRLEEINSRLDIIYRLFQKHHVQNSSSLLKIQYDIEEKLSHINTAEDQINQFKKEIKESESLLTELSNKISKNRTKASLIFEKEVKVLLKQLHMENAVLKIEIVPLDNFLPIGKDQIEFLFTANKGGRLLPIKQVASGGELSRLSLCIKSVVAEKMQLPTLIFDEIDSGISGEVALKMGDIIESLAKSHQILMITHSPQIASKASHHIFVSKQDLGSQTTAKVSILNKEEKVTEIAKMLSGDPPSKEAILNAKALLARR